MKANQKKAKAANLTTKQKDKLGSMAIGETSKYKYLDKMINNWGYMINQIENIKRKVNAYQTIIIIAGNKKFQTYLTINESFLVSNHVSDQYSFSSSSKAPCTGCTGKPTRRYANTRNSSLLNATGCKVEVIWRKLFCRKTFFAFWHI